MADCYKRFLKGAKGAGGEDAAKKMEDTIRKNAEERAANGENYIDALNAEIKANKDELTKRQYTLTQNFLKYQMLTSDVKARIAGGMSIRDALFSSIETPSGTTVQGGMASLEVNINALDARYFGKLTGGLASKNNKLIKMFQSSELDEPIQRALWDLSSGRKPNEIENTDIRQIATAIYGVQEELRLRANKSGANISGVPGGVLAQNHSLDKMATAGKKSWVNDVLPLLNSKTSFGGKFKNDSAGLKKALESAYDAMVTGVRYQSRLQYTDEKFFDFFGSQNLARRLSQKRELHFKNYDSWKKWHENYGEGFLGEQTIKDIQGMTQNIAMLEKFGTNPDVAWKNAVQNILEANRDKLSAEAQKSGKSNKEYLDSIKNKAQEIMDFASGKNQIAVNPTIAQFAGTTRSIVAMASLGKMLLSVISDIPLKASEYKYQGRTFLGGIAKSFTDIIGQTGVSYEEATKTASLLGVYMDAFTGGTNRFWDDKLTKTSRVFFDIIGNTWWTGRHKLAMTMTLSHDLALKKNISFNDLDDETLRSFTTYGITENDWNKLRQAASKIEGNNKEFIVTDLIKDDAVAEKYIGWIVSRQSFGVVEGGFKQQRQLSLGTKRGTASGELIRMLTQFKSFSYSMLTKVYGREIYGKQKIEPMTVTQLFLATVAFGYLAETSSDLLNGKTPKQPDKLETWYKAVARGGGLGLIGDFVLPEYGGTRKIIGAAAGPVLTKAGDIAEMGVGLVTRGKLPSSKKAFDVALSTIPFNNVIWTRPVLDQLLLNDVRKLLDPAGYARQQREQMKMYGQRNIDF
jgi:hypothetical protein